MEQRSLRVVSTNKNFFTKLTNTISRLLIPTKLGINGIMISIKRSSLVKAFEAYKNENKDEAKKENLSKKYEDAYTLYLEAIDKYIMDSIYKNVKNGTATEFEKDALSNYYEVIHLKQTEYLEYKYKKQQYLLQLDYQTLKSEEPHILKSPSQNWYKTPGSFPEICAGSGKTASWQESALLHQTY